MTQHSSAWDWDQSLGTHVDVVEILISSFPKWTLTDTATVSPLPEPNVSAIVVQAHGWRSLPTRVLPPCTVG
jgi:hypothetical protein